MFSVTNRSWLNALAAALPNTTVKDEDHPYFLHKSGLIFSVSDQRERYMFSIRNLHAINGTGVLCPIEPPRPITLDRQRTTAKIAAEVHRRLLLPGLEWLPKALQWQQEDAAREQELQIIREQFAALGRPNAIFTDIYHGYDPSWQARINSAQSVTLNLERLTVPQALTIIKLLQKEN